jgi:outer membrane lipoprotein carrier protein
VLAVWAGAAAPDVLDVLKGVEQRYNGVRTLEVHFQQTYTAPGRASRTESGTLFLRKPGRMRWQYSKPPGKLFVSDSKYFYLYNPLTHRAERSKVKETEDMRAPLAFLLGRLDFRRDFKQFVSRPRGQDLSITAEPRSNRAPFTQVQFLVAPDYQILEVEVSGQDNSVMRFRFKDEKLDPALKASLFQFHAPAGTEVVEEAQ